MANATASVKRAAYGYRSEILTHSYGTIANVTQLYAGAMVGLNAGYLAHFDDTAALQFFGLLKEKEGNPKLPTGSLLSGTAGDGTLDLDVFQPKYFELNIVGVAITDIGRTVYALDDQTGTLDPTATTFANVVGVVKDLVYATDPSSPVANYAKVQPIYVPSSAALRAASASGALAVKPGGVVVTKAGVAALTLAAPTAGVDDGKEIEITSNTAFAHTLTATGLLQTGTASVNVATFAAFAGAGLRLMAYQGKWNVLAAVAITFS